MEAWKFSYTIQFEKLENFRSLVKNISYTFNIVIKIFFFLTFIANLYFLEFKTPLLDIQYNKDRQRSLKYYIQVEFVQKE